MNEKYSIGMVGLGVMGRSLSLNFHRHGIPVAGFDLDPHLPDDFEVKVVSSLKELVGILERPRILFLMVPAGQPVEDAINSLKPLLDRGDVIIDGGNSHFTDTERRVNDLSKNGIHLVGMGVSGGESGALKGPSLMPGGAEKAWSLVKDHLEAIAARADDGTPCVAWMGPGGAGHYVKMVHNGIEYAEMQSIAEVYDLLHRGAGMTNKELSAVFQQWNQGELNSYLVGITAIILGTIDELTRHSLVDFILDEAAQKGTGKWTSQSALDIGAAIPTITTAVDSRFLSALKSERVLAAEKIGGIKRFKGNKEDLIKAAGKALYAARIATYAQGLSLLRMASAEFNWELDIAVILKTWRAGCIIRAAVLEDISEAYHHKPDLTNLMVDEVFSKVLLERQSAWRETLKTALDLGIPMAGISASLAYFDAYRSAVLPANLTQAQRDYFGAHTYQRCDRPGIFHTEWEE